MKAVINFIFKAAMVLTLLSVIGGGIYGCYWLTKTVSYSFFYEGMVERTITKMVKPEYLK